MRIISPDAHRINDKGEYDFSPESSDRAFRLAFEQWHEACYRPATERVRALITVGLPGSGKSTFLADWRGIFWENEMNQIDVAFDATLTNRLARRPLIEIARDSGNTVIEALVFDVPLAVALQRNSVRPPGRRVPYPTMMRMAAQLEAEPPTVAEGLWRVTAVSRGSRTG